MSTAEQAVLREKTRLLGRELAALDADQQLFVLLLLAGSDPAAVRHALDTERATRRDRSGCAVSEKLPERVYLVTVDGEWPVSAIADDNPGIIAQRVASEVERRQQSGNVYRPDQVKVWCADLANVRPVDLLPATTVRPSLRERAE